LLIRRRSVPHVPGSVPTVHKTPVQNLEEKSLHMFRNWMINGLMLAICLAPVAAVGAKLPTVNGKQVVATVAGEPILLEEFNRELMNMHRIQSDDGQGAPVKDSEPQAGKISYRDTLQRIIDTRLILQEAHNIGIDELPEIKKEMDIFFKDQLMAKTASTLVQGAEASPEEVEKIYRPLVREAKVKSLLFKDQEKATEAREKIAKGADFKEIAEKAIADKVAEGDAEGHYLKRDDLLPVIEEVIDNLKPGETSPMLKVPNGYTFFHVDELRYPENAEQRRQAEKQALDHARKNAFKAGLKRLHERYVVIHQDVLDAVDYDTIETPIEELLKDTRVAAEIKPSVAGAEAEKITIGDLTALLKKEFYHSLEKAIEENRADNSKERLLYETIDTKILLQEGRRLGLDQDPVLLKRVEQYRKGLTFNKFISMAIAPEIDLKKEDLQKEYDQHIEDYSTPRMLKLDSIVFSEASAGRAALEKYNQGTDFQWLKSNAEGRITDPEKAKKVNQIAGILTEKSLPAEIRIALNALKAGQARVCEAPKKEYTYLLLVQKEIPPEPMGFEKAQEKIRTKLIGEALTEGVRKYVAELRKHYKVKILDPSLK